MMSMVQGSKKKKKKKFKMVSKPRASDSTFLRLRGILIQISGAVRPAIL